MSISGADTSSSTLGPRLVTESDSFRFQHLGDGEPMAKRLRKPVHDSMLARTSAATLCTSVLCASPACLSMATTSEHGTPTVTAIGRPPWVHDNSDGHIGSVALKARRSVLKATPTRRVFVVGRRSVTNLD